MSSWHSYPSIYNLGHRAVFSLLTVPHVIEEKIDGSQFSFGKFRPDTDEGYVSNVRIRSKGVEMMIDAPVSMFKLAAAAVKERESLLHEGWTYRGEFLAKPGHNTLVYDRVPKGNVILFDVNTDEENYLTPAEKAAEAERIGLECVPVLRTAQGNETTVLDIRALLETPSVLGGQKIEGVVVKPLVQLYGTDKKLLIGKFVSEAFKEVHQGVWRENNPKSGDILDTLCRAYTSAARWDKAIQHLRDAGRLEDSPRDIGLLIAEIPGDIKAEAEGEIKDKLFAWAWPHLRRKCVAGVAEFYKQKLLEKQFETAA